MNTLSSRMELAHFKRRFRAEGFFEAEIHDIIRDRPRPTTAPAEPH